MPGHLSSWQPELAAVTGGCGGLRTSLPFVRVLQSGLTWSTKTRWGAGEQAGDADPGCTGAGAASARNGLLPVTVPETRERHLPASGPSQRACSIDRLHFQKGLQASRRRACTAKAASTFSHLRLPALFFLNTAAGRRVGSDRAGRGRRRSAAAQPPQPHRISLKVLRSSRLRKA